MSSLIIGLAAVVVLSVLIDIGNKLGAIARHLGALETTLGKLHDRNARDLGRIEYEVQRLREHFDPDIED